MKTRALLLTTNAILLALLLAVVAVQQYEINTLKTQMRAVQGAVSVLDWRTAYRGLQP